MTSPTVTKNQIIRTLDDLPPENLVAIAEFILSDHTRRNLHAASSSWAAYGKAMRLLKMTCAPRDVKRGQA